MSSQGKQPDQVEFAVGCSPVCDVVRKPKRRKRKSRPAHRLLGAFTALPLVWVLITGFFLNHAEDFKLDTTKVSHPWVLAAYGMLPEGQAYRAEHQGVVVTEWDGVVFYHTRVLENTTGLRAVAGDTTGLALLLDDTIIRLDSAGEEIERLDELSFPAMPVDGLASYEGKVALLAAGDWYLPDADWVEYDKVDVVLEPAGLELVNDTASLEFLQREWSGGGVSMSRLMLDLHAGNFLGAFAKYFYDLVIVCTLVLIGTGLVLQWRSSGRGRASNAKL